MLNMTEDPLSLDPRMVRTIKDLTIQKLLFEGLMRMDREGRPLPALAETVEISDDKLYYTFHLRDAKWTNGDPVLASDFIYAWHSLLDPKFPTDCAHMLFPIKNAKQIKEGKYTQDSLGAFAKDDQTLIVELENPTPYFLELLSLPITFPIHPKIASKDQFVSNGPFRLEKWTPETTFELKKNETYWEKEKVFLEGVVLSVVADNTTESLLYEKGELDWLGQPLSTNISTELLAQLRENNKLHSYPVAGTFWLKYNTLKAPFDNVKLRQALSYAISREKLITHILRGAQQVAREVLPPSIALNDALFEDHNVDLSQKLLKEYLAEKNLTAETMPEITLSYNPSERNVKIVQFVADEWRKALGLTIKLEAVELQYYRQKVRVGQFEVGTGEWIADFNDPIAILELFKYKDNGINDTGWHNDEYSLLLEKSKTTLCKKGRNTLLAAAEKILVDSMPVAPLYHYSFDYVKREGVEDVVLSPLGSADFKSARKL